MQVVKVLPEDSLKIFYKDNYRLICQQCCVFSTVEVHVCADFSVKPSCGRNISWTCALKRCWRKKRSERHSGMLSPRTCRPTGRTCGNLSGRSVWPYLSHCGLMMPYGGIALGQAMACCLTAPSHYLNQCWLLIGEVLHINLRVISQWVPKLLFCVMNLEIIVLELVPQLPVAMS